jgi:Fe-S cluster assembly iron-binding protein IscA
MALDESTDGLEELNSNGVTAYIDPKLHEYLARIGDIKIDFVTNEMGSGYMIRIGDVDCSQSGCNSCQ